MTQPLPPSLSPEEREFAQRLARIGPHGEPSPAIDASILAAAHARTQDAATAARRPMRPRWPLALGMAASVVLAVGIAWQVRPLPEGRQPDQVRDVVALRSTTPPSAPAEGGSTDADAPTAAESAMDESSAASQAPAAPQRTGRVAATSGRADEARAVAAMEQHTAQQPALAAPSVAAASAEPAATTATAAKIAAPQAANGDAMPMTGAASAAGLPATRDAQAGADIRRAAAAPASNQAAAAQAATASKPIANNEPLNDEPLDDVPPATADSPMVRDAWLQRIRVLVERGDSARARASLQAFQRRYPGYPLPDDLRALQR